jgi:hypothetical protein
MTRPERFLKYLLFMGVSFAIPISVMAVCIAASGEREYGMAIGLGIAFIILIVLNVFYSFYLLKSSALVNVICATVVTIISLGLTYLAVFYEMRFKSDFYGLWTILLIYGLSSIIAWEIFYQALNKMNAR